MKKYLVLLVFIALVLQSCNNKTEIKSTDETAMDHKIMATLWYQRSSELVALYYQGFNLAKSNLAKIVESNSSNEKLAVVVDVDETMLDNSPQEVRNIRTGQAFNQKNWKAWTDLMKAKALPGAVEFSTYAKSLGVDVFYISNRSVDELESTLQNLKKEGFAFADEAHILLKSTTSVKTSRRNKVSETHKIVLLIGDNLGDFDEVFEDRSVNDGKNTVEAYKDHFGTKFIVMPNPMYGGWEKYIYDGDYSKSKEEQYRLRKEKLIGIEE